MGFPMPWRLIEPHPCSEETHHASIPHAVRFLIAPFTPQAKIRLRALCLPITLFGETHAQRSARLLLAEEDKGHHQDDFTLADGHNVVSPSHLPLFLPLWSA